MQQEANCCSRKPFRKPLAACSSPPGLLHCPMPFQISRAGHDSPKPWVSDQGSPNPQAALRGGTGWPERCPHPASPAASFLEDLRENICWAAKLNLPPSCQGIGKAVRGEGKGESGGSSGGREGGGGKEAGGQARSPSYSGTACLVSCCSRTEQPQLPSPKQRSGRQAFPVSAGYLKP